METARLKALGVVLPTLNCRDRLEFHLQHCLPWLKEAGEIVVVDSFSTDGTWELLRETLLPLGAKLIQRPRGLYESWNAGIGEITKQWLYISTVGDIITPEGLNRLLTLGEQNASDVVISPPLIVDEASNPLPAARTTMEEILALAPSPETTRKFDPVLFFYWTAWYALVGGMNTPLGSSAGNIYSTKILRQWNFPTEYGSAGDAFWCIQHAPFLHVSATAEKVSHFMMHPRPHSKESSARLHRWTEQAHTILREHYLKMSSEGKISSLGQSLWHWMEDYHLRSSEWNRMRESSLPRFLSPRALGLKLQLKKMKRHKSLVAGQIFQLEAGHSAKSH